jgi:hypothetical protein
VTFTNVFVPPKYCNLPKTAKLIPPSNFNGKVTTYDWNLGRAYMDIPPATSYPTQVPTFTLSDSSGSVNCPMPMEIVDCSAKAYTCIEPKL